MSRALKNNANQNQNLYVFLRRYVGLQQINHLMLKDILQSYLVVNNSILETVYKIINK